MATCGYGVRARHVEWKMEEGEDSSGARTRRELRPLTSPSSYLHPTRHGSRNLAGDPFQDGWVDAHAAGVGQAFAAELEEDAAVGERERKKKREGGLVRRERAVEERLNRFWLRPPATLLPTHRYRGTRRLASELAAAVSVLAGRSGEVAGRPERAACGAAAAALAAGGHRRRRQGEGGARDWGGACLVRWAVRLAMAGAMCQEGAGVPCAPRRAGA